ncbi:MAG: phosphomannomutase [Pseudomonadales bacterium]|nr:phosphomannomutase [Pseudomonadales bacterium]MBO6566127.1 phosphomannomutase [Pseudomonadales bacterium]MBO6595548.1 phosphomannomutase [Pseudomonadales bacterium]MBO6658088.1 phosphomannomutase [Pseudomonadales bacterium]MBO6702047.1 phosphomannomutase [Pseudomonadales bacterium]
MSLNTSAFKAYDIRGRVPDELNEDIAFAIGRAYAQFLKPSEVVVGHDIRLSSPELTEALVKGLNASGVNVTHIGMCGTEEIYFATDHYGFDGGIVVTASHNPADYNGMKMVQKGARPISGDSGLIEIRDAVGANNFPHAPGGGRVNKLDHRGDYIEKLLGYVDLEKLSGMKVVANPGNGAAGPVVQSLMEKLPIDFVPVHFEADGTFPNGVPNPLIPENRPPTIDAIAKNDADLGVAWDGDFDRCFLFDENGRFIEGYYIVGLLAQAFLDKTPGSSIVHDPRLTWNTIDIVGEKGNAIQSKTGHAFIKERMRSEDAIYGGEMSAHHYFRDFAYCDSGMVPWLLVIDLMAKQDKKLSELVDERMAAFPCSGEINRRIDDAASLLAELEREYGTDALSVEKTDGLSVEYADWRFNVRSSNTEPVVRLNVESRGSESLMQEKTDELLARMGGDPA